MTPALFIACKDFWLNIRSARFFIGLLLCLLFVPFVMTAGIDDYRMQCSIHKDLTARADSLLYKDTYVWSGVRPQVVKRPDLLSIFCKGITSNVGVDNQIQLGEYPFFSAPNGDAATRNNPFLNAFLRLDFMSAMGIVFSLLALAFSYDTFCREREEGTMRMVFAQPLRRSSFLFGKLLGGLFTQLPMLICCFLLALTHLLLQPDIHLLDTDWTGISFLFLTSVLYSLLFLLIGMLISLLVHRSNTAIMASLLFWLSFQFVIPPLVALLSQIFVRVPLYEGVVLEMRALNREFGVLEDKNWQETTNQFGATGSKGRPIMNERAADGYNEIWGSTPRIAQMRMSLNTRTEPLRIWYADRKWQVQLRFFEQVIRQQQLQQIFSGLSPLRIYSQAASLICHTSPQDYLSYMKEVRDYRQEVIRFFTMRRIFGSLSYVSTEKPEELIDNDVYEEMMDMYKGGASDSLARYWMDKMKVRPLLAEVGELPVFRQSVVTVGGQLQAVFGLWIGFMLVSAGLLGVLVKLFLRYDIR